MTERIIMTRAEKAILENQVKIFHGLRLILSGQDNTNGFMSMQDGMLRTEHLIANARIVEG